MTTDELFNKLAKTTLRTVIEGCTTQKDVATITLGNLKHTLELRSETINNGEVEPDSSYNLKRVRYLISRAESGDSVSVIRYYSSFDSGYPYQVEQLFNKYRYADGQWY